MNIQTITIEQRAEFLEKGFLVLPNALPANLLSTLQELIAELNEEMLKSYTNSSPIPNASFIEEKDKPLLARVNDLLGVYPEAVLELLASPIMMSIAKDLCGPDVVPLQCDVLFKHNHPQSFISWHQDAPHSRKFPYLNIGIYLDDADIGDGCVDYVPHSQHEVQDIGKLTQKHGYTVPNRVSASVKAGDILIQDMMVLHASQVKRKEGIRRTIYVEMRPAAAILDQGVQSKEWAELRRRWMGIVKRRSTVIWPEDFLESLPQDLKSDEEEIKQILQHREPPIPANYGFPIND
ncbi:phytanoyl-CoA dioxygenase family protein [Algoriphagus yeomjeoni]|uniref:phytanoyl-CoA dioxygenase family protein n=1 Tax=Algoriphagus yeomjeoni TaxID=291403 RepID=UPI003CE50B96